MSISTATIAQLDQLIAALRDGERGWAAESLASRRNLLLQMHANVAAQAEEWVRVAGEIKQLPAGSPLLGEEWISGPWAVLGYAEALADSLARLAEGRNLLAGYPVGTAPGGRVAIDVLPHHMFDRLLLSGFRAEVWMEPGVTAQETQEQAGLGLRTPEQTAGVAVVMGAGNITSIPPLDVLYQLYAHNQVVLLKLNPVTDALLPVFEAVFAPFIDRGYLRIVTGDAKVGDHLVTHESVDAVHITGSEATHDAIVWGAGAAGATAKAAGTPRLTKPITSELGGVSPTIVVPGRWSAADIRFQAEHIATHRLHNSGFNCIAAQVVIVSKDWPQKQEFFTALRAAFAAAPARPAWYPGCDARVAGARQEHPGFDGVGGTAERTLLWNLDLADGTESAFGTEYFGPVLGVAELPGTGVEFLNAAVDVANERMHGTLGANLIIDNRTRRQLGAHLRESIARLRYGTIGVNAWTGVGYLTPRATWGAFPGHPLDDVQSGRGVVHNSLLLHRPERTVVYGPFRPLPRSVMTGEFSLTPKPPWFVTNRTAATTGRRLTAFAARPRWSALPAIFTSALRG
ncbi:acyl-CoA reductase-like NAD-dependent aldehyde dehydrogenase [Micromonospora kangleipakensis]|uniref:Acyl-CoA reductase-like NAD-dependent aldehyde dehydrogenase n=1 Tax=Micromonospora kangleipakensis TaxID=1077942 RepID=A0A4Q8BHJ2_9ACTN|nr:aldehyde dehydrogenase family protein [Micromonospora kangleipakensis]RZU76823.1 acyl-CoA reductase-like NAD-dependent aldehyde dehydrogenase [Micromonospora kangleipakensis]